MCDAVFCNARIYETVGQLRLLAGIDPVPSGTALDPDDFCLCNVDIPATAEKAGATLKPDPFGYEWVAGSVPDTATEPKRAD